MAPNSIEELHWNYDDTSKVEQNIVRVRSVLIDLDVPYLQFTRNQTFILNVFLDSSKFPSEQVYYTWDIVWADTALQRLFKDSTLYSKRKEGTAGSDSLMTFYEYLRETRVIVPTSFRKRKEWVHPTTLMHHGTRQSYCTNISTGKVCITAVLNVLQMHCCQRTKTSSLKCSTKVPAKKGPGNALSASMYRPNWVPTRSRTGSDHCVRRRQTCQEKVTPMHYLMKIIMTMINPATRKQSSAHPSDRGSMEAAS
jgi:hypothetical protein